MAIGFCVSCVPSKALFRRRPCQWTVASRSPRLVTLIRISAPSATRSVGPGIEPPYPSIRIRASPSCLATGSMDISICSSCATSITRVGRASGRPVGSVGKLPLCCGDAETSCCISISLPRGHLRRGRGACAIGCAATACRGGALGDALRDELRVVFDPAQEGGAARVLPRQAEHVEPGNFCDAATGDDTFVVVRDRKVK